jgi:hypothetical protein
VRPAPPGAQQPSVTAPKSCGRARLGRLTLTCDAGRRS